jgi:hypothetical protein
VNILYTNKESTHTQLLEEQNEIPETLTPEQNKTCAAITSKLFEQEEYNKEKVIENTDILIQYCNQLLTQIEPNKITLQQLQALYFTLTFDSQ